MNEQLFVVPYDYPNFGRTVESPELDPSEFPDEFPDAVQETDTPRIWGVRDGNRNESYYEKMEPGDGLLFYNSGTYRFAGRVEEKFESSWISRRYWGHAPSTMLYTVTDFLAIRLPRHQLNNLVGYTDDWYPQGLQRISDAKMSNLSSHYGSLEPFFDDFATE